MVSKTYYDRLRDELEEYEVAANLCEEQGLARAARRLRHDTNVAVDRKVHRASQHNADEAACPVGSGATYTTRWLYRVTCSLCKSRRS